MECQMECHADIYKDLIEWASLVAQCREDLVEKEMATHSNILAWEIPWTEDPGRLQSMRLQRIGHNLVTKQQCNKMIDGPILT